MIEDLSKEETKAILRSNDPIPTMNHTIALPQLSKNILEICASVSDLPSATILIKLA